MHDVLKGWGHEVVLVDTTRTKQIGIRQHGRKTDRIDAELLARAVEQGGIPVAHVLSPARRELRDALGVRRALVETRTQYIATIRGLARSRGERIGTCAADDFLTKLEKAHLGPDTRATIAPLASALQRVALELARTNARLEELGKGEPVIERLTTAPGVGLVVAAAFVSVVDEALLGAVEGLEHVAEPLPGVVIAIPARGAYPEGDDPSGDAPPQVLAAGSSDLVEVLTAVRRVFAGAVGHEDRSDEGAFVGVDRVVSRDAGFARCERTNRGGMNTQTGAVNTRFGAGQTGAWSA